MAVRNGSATRVQVLNPVAVSKVTAPVEAAGEGPDQLKDNSDVQNLIDHGKDRGYLTFDEINDSQVHEELDAEQIEEIFQLFADEGIKVVGKLKEYPRAQPETIAPPTVGT